ncbi:MAG: trimethylamine methyltransferase family protein, partial [Woeseia sp.]
MTRRRHREKRVVAAVHQLPWQRVRNPHPPIKVLSDDQVEAILSAALSILETKGFRFLEKDSLQLLKNGGADGRVGDRGRGPVLVHRLPNH